MFTKYFLICVFVFLSSSDLFSQSFQSLNFEGAGYVTEVYAPTHVTGLLYCRTDIGGLYRSEGYPATWEFISQQFISPGGLMIQGLAYYYQGNPGFIIIACGTDYLPNDPNRGVWKSNNAWQGNPVTWTKTLDINFGGNDDYLKVGGECITFDNNLWSSNIVYVGGLNSGIFRSNNTGDTWTQIASNTQVTV